MLERVPERDPAREPEKVLERAPVQRHNRSTPGQQKEAGGGITDSVSWMLLVLVVLLLMVLFFGFGSLVIGGVGIGSVVR